MESKIVNKQRKNVAKKIKNKRFSTSTIISRMFVCINKFIYKS